MTTVGNNNNKSMTPKKRNNAATTTTTTTTIPSSLMNGSSSSTSTPSSKRNKFEHTKPITEQAMAAITEYTILDLQRLLHVMETTTPPLSSSSTNEVGTPSWKDYEIRCTLLQDMYTTLIRNSTSNKKIYGELQQYQSRVTAIVQTTQQYIAQQQQQQQDTGSNTIDPMEKLLASVQQQQQQLNAKVPVVPTTNTKKTNIQPTSNKKGKEVVQENIPVPTNGKKSSKISTSTTTTKSSIPNTIENIQQTQREQMEEAVSVMAAQMKVKTQEMSEQLQIQNNVVLEQLHDTVEQNVIDMTQVTKLTQDHVKKSTTRSYQLWTMIIIILAAFVGTIFFILIIPKPNNHKYIKYLQYPAYVSPSTTTNNKDANCRLLPSGVEECYIINTETIINTTTTTTSGNNEDTHVEDVGIESDVELQDASNVVEEKNIVEEQRQQEVHNVATPEEDGEHEEVVPVVEEEPIVTNTGEDDPVVTNTEEDNPVVTNTGEHDPVVINTGEDDHNVEQELPDMSKLYTEMLHHAIHGNVDIVLQQYVQMYPTIVEYADMNGWTIMHELTRNVVRQNRNTVEDDTIYNHKVQIIQHIVNTFGRSVLYVPNRNGQTPYDMSLQHDNPEQLHPIRLYYDQVIMGGQQESMTTSDIEEATQATPESVTLPDEVIVDSTTTEENVEHGEIPQEVVVQDEVVPDNDMNIITASDVSVNDMKETFQLALSAIIMNDIEQLRALVDEHVDLTSYVDEENNGMTLLHHTVVQAKHAGMEMYDFVQLLIESEHINIEQTTYGYVNDETGIVDTPPQTALDIAIASFPDLVFGHYHPIVLLLQHATGLISDEEFDTYIETYEGGEEGDEDEVEGNDEEVEEEYEEREEECEIDVSTGLCRETVVEDENDLQDDSMHYPDVTSDDAIEDALREFEEMKHGSQS